MMNDAKNIQSQDESPGSATVKNPYKGLLSYREEDKELFKGRETEKKELCKLVEYNFMTVVFGKSGIGKTSLLNAGLIPELREKDFLPIKLRLDYSPSAPGLMEQVKEKISEELKKNKIEEKEPGDETGELGDGETLWEYFHRVKHFDDTGGKMITPVLVFDPFEEIFTLGKNHPGVTGLLEELYCLAENQVPDAVKRKIKQEKKKFPYMKGKINVRILISLREDYLPHLNSLKSTVPAIDRVMYRVIHLNGKQAQEIIKQGGIQDENAVTGILNLFQPEDDNRVQPEKLEIEPSILSLLCFQLFEKGVQSITKRDQDKILMDFYDSTMKKFPAEVNKFIESKLLTEGGFRTPFYLDRNHKLRRSIDKLVDGRIIRKVYLGEKEHIEIIHDVLAPIIKEKRNRRVKKTKNVIIGILSVFLAVFIFLTFYAFHQKRKAERQLVNSLISKADLMVNRDNVKAVRIAEAAYMMTLSDPPPRLMRVLSAVTFSTLEHPFYNVMMRHDHKVIYAVFSPHDNNILTCSSDNTAKRWNLKGEPLTDLKKHTGVIKPTLFSPDGTRILTVSPDGTAKLLDLQGNLLTNFNKHTGVVNSAVFSPDGTRILTASDDKTAKLWNLRGELSANLNEHTSFVNSAVFSPDGTRILTASSDGTAKLWNLQGECLVNLNKHTKGVISAEFSADGNEILTYSFDKTVKLWNLKGDLLADLNQHTAYVNSAVFSADGTKILTASDDKTARLWDLKKVFLLDLDQHAGAVKSAVFSPDGTRILTASSDGTVKLWNLNGECLTDLKEHTGGVKSAVFSPDGTRILIASWDTTAKLLDLNGRFLTAFKGHTGAVNTAVFSPGGTRILTASADGTVRRWDLQGKPLFDFKAHNEDVYSAVFSPDGTRILTASLDKTAKLWNLQGKLLLDLNRHTGAVTSAVFSSDGKRILTASSDGTAKLWNLQGELLEDYKHPIGVNYAVFSPDDSRILTASDDKTAKLWNMQGELLADFDKHIGKVRSAVFSPDGTRVLTCSDDKTAKLWYTPGAIIRWLKTADIPRLSKKEKKELGID